MRRHLGFLSTLLAFTLQVPTYASEPAAADLMATGVVFDDRNGDGKRDPGEPGLKDIRVSNQHEIVLTDREGRWHLAATDDTTFFVIKPRGWMPPLSRDRLPRFYYVHKPKGSPPVKYGGVAPTGPLPASIDFPLRREKEPDSFSAIFFGDTQPRDVREVEYFSHDIVEDLIGKTDARFGVTLGDVVFDDLSVFGPHNATVALIGLPWWNVLGNHDQNYDVPDDRDSDETWTRVFGPNYYSFDYGPVHFVALDDVIWEGAAPQSTGKYSGGITPAQLDWLRSDLKFVPDKQLVVLMMHIPLTDLTNRHDVYRIIENRPHCFSISGHTHWQEHKIIRHEDGWLGPAPHHHAINVTACGSWWTGAPDELGVPHATMRDGAPNGHSILTFKDRKVTIDFRAARRPASHQMNIVAPEVVRRRSVVEVYVNVFNGGPDSLVDIRLDNNGTWTRLQKVSEPDPSYVAARNREPEKPAEPYRRMPEPIKSPHLWKGRIEMPVAPGEHFISVRANDIHGRWFTAERALRVE
jgi:hypothetical protein